MSERDESLPADGGAAFPTEGGLTRPRSDGMSLRDYFAAAALQLMSDAELLKEVGRQSKIEGKNAQDGAAQLAYEMADAMLRARK